MPIITVAGIDAAISALKLKKNSLKARMLQTIRERLHDEEAISRITAIAPEELIAGIWETADPEVVSKKRKNLSSIKSGINQDLKRLDEAGENPEGLVLNRKNVFEISAAKRDSLLEKIGSLAGADASMVEDFQAFRNRFGENFKEKGLPTVHELLEELDASRKHVEELTGELSTTRKVMEELSQRLTTREEETSEELQRLREQLAALEASIQGGLADTEVIEISEEDLVEEDEAPVEQTAGEVVEEFIEEEEQTTAFEEISEDELVEVSEDEGNEIQDVQALQEVEEVDEIEDAMTEEKTDVVELAEDEIEEVFEADEAAAVEEISEGELVEISEDEGDEIQDLQDLQEVEEVCEIEDAMTEEKTDVIELAEDEIEEVFEEDEAAEVKEITEDELVEVSEDEGEEIKDVQDLQELQEVEEVDEIEDALLTEEKTDVVELAEDEIEEVLEADEAAAVEEIPDDELVEVDEDDGEEIKDLQDLQEVEEVDEIEDALTEEKTDVIELAEDEIEEVFEEDEAAEVEEIPEDELVEVDGEEIKDVQDLQDLQDLQEVEEVDEIEDALAEEKTDVLELAEDEIEEVLEEDEAAEVEEISEDELIGVAEDNGEEIQKTEEIDEGLLNRLKESLKKDSTASRSILSRYFAPEQVVDSHGELLEEQDQDYLAQVLSRFTPKFIKIPAGDYRVGSSRPRLFEQAEHMVTLEPFHLGQYPVTNELFEIFIRETGYETDAERNGFGVVLDGRFVTTIDPLTGRESFTIRNGNASRRVEGANWRHPRGPGTSMENKHNHPVVQVSRADAIAFASWAGKRLPTEEEWEAAARGRDSRLFPWGNMWSASRANFESSHVGDTTPVTRYIKTSASPFGICDLLGNVHEWTATFYPGNPGTSIKPGRGRVCILKGGCWASMGVVPASGRFLEDENYWSNVTGFRCAV